MEIRDHGRYDYSPITERRDYSWPDGKRLAFYVALNVEHFSFGGQFGHTPTALGPPPDPRNYAWRDYGLRVGIWRVFDLMDEHGLPMCHLINSAACDYAPQIVARIKQRGDEVIGHGRTNSERQSDLGVEDERRLIDEATQGLKRHFGVAPRGWMGPWIAETVHTPDLLKQAGYSFLMDWPADDQPFWMKTRYGPLLSIPYPIEINDSPVMLSRAQPATDFRQMILDQFETMVTLSKAQPLVFGLSLHTFVAGQPFRLAQIRRALGEIMRHPQFDRVWITTPGGIAAHVTGLPDGSLP